MDISLSRTQLVQLLNGFVHFFIVKTGATLLIVGFLFTIGGGLQTYTQGLVTMVAHSAWLGTAPEGHIRVYSCTDGLAIDRLTIVGNTNPCPESEVTMISIEESAKASTQYFQQILLFFYLMSLVLTITWTALTTKHCCAYVSEIFNNVKASLSRRK